MALALTDVSNSPARIRALKAQKDRRVISSSSANNATNTTRDGTSQGANPFEADQGRFDEWIKMATDNKINSTNTWSFALIDYFADLTLLRSPDDNSINFQKASCTLDGCVKIWTSRVDSVATETGKLLSGLAADGKGDSLEEDADAAGSGDEDGAAAARRKRKATRAATTLADTFDKIRTKAFDLEFTVDPLFKKTSADFDEGGAKGILMNHLACDGSMRVVFDAGDAKLSMGDDEEQEDEDEDEDEDDQVQVDLAKLKGLVPAIQDFSSYVLCPSLASFQFSGQSTTLAALLASSSEGDSQGSSGGAGETYRPNQTLGDTTEFGQFALRASADDEDEDDGGAAFDYGDIGAGGGAGEEDFFATDDAAAASSSGAGAGEVYEGEGSPVYEQQEQGGAYQSTMVNAGEEEGGVAGILDYFDTTVKRSNWAGPEHWKLKRRVGFAAASTSKAAAGADGEEGEKTTTKSKKDKQAFAFDFTADPPMSVKELFAAPSSAASIRVSNASRKSSLSTRASTGSTRSRRSTATLPAVKEDATAAADTFTLPEDVGFSSQVLLRLFVKPKAYINLRKRRVAPSFNNAQGGNSSTTFAFIGQDTEDGELDPGFWVAAPAGDQPENEVYTGEGGGAGGESDEPAIPFNTQWLDDGDADFDVGIDDEPEDEGEGDLMAAAAAEGPARTVRPEMVNYAKRAKRVDVKKLKETIWKELQLMTAVIEGVPVGATATPDTSIEGSPAPAPAAAAVSAREDAPEPEAFKSVITGLRKSYPKDKMAEISTSYCFICLLHLCNEKGLGLKKDMQVVDEEDEELGEDEDEEPKEGRMHKSVGKLEKIRIVREVF